MHTHACMHAPTVSLSLSLFNYQSWYMNEVGQFNLTISFFQIWQYLSFEATQTHFHFVLSKLDYCNALLAGFLQVLLDKLQRVINCSAFLISIGCESACITPFLYDLHWLPISSRIQYKIALICFHIVSGTVPLYLFELLHLYSPAHSLCSSSDTQIFCVLRMGRRTLGKKSFQHIRPVIWNSLPLSVRHSSSFL